MPYINIFDKNIYYEIYGEGNKNALLYLHGGPGASCLVLIAEKGKLGEAYNISSNGEKGNYSAIDQIADIIAFCSNEMMDGKKIEVKVRNFEKNRKPGVKLNNDKIKELGWKVTTDLKNGIKETICLYMN